MNIVTQTAQVLLKLALMPLVLFVVLARRDLVQAHLLILFTRISSLFNDETTHKKKQKSLKGSL